MHDPELKYCPQCNDEYRPEAEKCFSCGITLILGLELIESMARRQERKAQRKGALTADDDLVTIRRGQLAEMKAYEELLGHEKIGTILAGDESSCGAGCCGGKFDLVVRREDAPDAMAIIDNEIRRTSVIDADDCASADSVFNPMAAENICPACGHRFTGGTECPDCGLCF